MHSLMIPLALAAATLAPTPPPAPAAPTMTLDDLLAICRAGPEKGIERIKALPEKSQTLALVICIAYEQGRREGPRLPAGIDAGKRI